jgi:hypothetical protein
MPPVDVVEVRPHLLAQLHRGRVCQSPDLFDHLRELGGVLRHPVRADHQHGHDQEDEDEELPAVDGENPSRFGPRRSAGALSWVLVGSSWQFARCLRAARSIRLGRLVAAMSAMNHSHGLSRQPAQGQRRGTTIAATHPECTGDSPEHGGHHGHREPVSHKGRDGPDADALRATAFGRNEWSPARLPQAGVQPVAGSGALGECRSGPARPVTQRRRFPHSWMNCLERTLMSGRPGHSLLQGQSGWMPPRDGPASRTGLTWSPEPPVPTRSPGGSATARGA